MNYRDYQIEMEVLNREAIRNHQRLLDLYHAGPAPHTPAGRRCREVFYRRVHELADRSRDAFESLDPESRSLVIAEQRIALEMPEIADPIDPETF